MSLWAKLKMAVVSAVAFFIVLFLAWRSGKKDGRAEKEKEIIIDKAEHREHVNDVKNEIDNGINKLPSSGSSDRLKHGWMREDD